MEAIESYHSIIDLDTAWDCKECSKKNSRQLDACEKCKVPRVVRKSKQDSSQTKFRAALPTSRESQTVRSKLQGKLRAQYQRELDVLDEAAEAGGAAGGRRRVVGFGPQAGAGPR